VRGRDAARECFERIAIGRRQQDIDTRTRRTAAFEERQPVHVIPVQVTEQQASVVRLSVEERGDCAQPGASVEHQRRPLALMGNCDR
jgi:hypothetical protein